MGQISILLVHRYRILADSLRACLDATPGVRVAGIYDRPEAAIREAGRVAIDVVIFDLETCAGASRFIRDLERVAPQTKALPLAVSCRDRIVELLEAGARGYTTLNSGFEELQRAIHQVDNDQAPASPLVVEAVLGRLRELSDGAGAPARHRRGPTASELTPKERRVLDFLAEGCTNREIGRKMGISVSTVKMHVHHLLGKLGVEKRREAVRVAGRMGLVEPRRPSLPLSGGSRPSVLR